MVKVIQSLPPNSSTQLHSYKDRKHNVGWPENFPGKYPSPGKKLWLFILTLPLMNWENTEGTEYSRWRNGARRAGMPKLLGPSMPHNPAVTVAERTAVTSSGEWAGDCVWSVPLLHGCFLALLIVAEKCGPCCWQQQIQKFRWFCRSHREDLSSSPVETQGRKSTF